MYIISYRNHIKNQAYEFQIYETWNDITRNNFRGVEKHMPTNQTKLNEIVLRQYILLQTVKVWNRKF